MNTEVTNTTAPVVGAESTQSAQQSVATQTSAQSDKAARFINRAENQASKILAEIEGMKKLSNKKYYQYSDAQISELFGAIQATLDEAKAQFTTDAPEKKKLFTFSA